MNRQTKQTLIEYELAYQKEHPKRKPPKRKDDKIVHSTNNKYLDDIDYRIMEKMRKKSEQEIKSKLDVTKGIAKNNLESITLRLTKVENSDSRDSGVGLQGGHIARKFRCQVH